MLGHDLEEVLPGQVIAGFQIDDLHLAAIADKAGDIVERHVIGRLGVVQAAACVTLDEKRGTGHFILPNGDAAVQLRRNGRELKGNVWGGSASALD